MKKRVRIYVRDHHGSDKYMYRVGGGAPMGQTVVAKDDDGDGDGLAIDHATARSMVACSRFDCDNPLLFAVDVCFVGGGAQSPSRVGGGAPQ